METIINWLTENILILFALQMFSIWGFIYFGRKVRAIKKAEFMVGTQHLPLDEANLNNWYEQAKAAGDGDAFLKGLRLVRQKYGHQGVKFGHVYWIVSLIKEDHSFDDVDLDDIPSFVRKEAGHETA